MKKYKLIGILLLGICIQSCDFLDREPLDFGDEDAYFRNSNDLKLSVNEFYTLFPKMNSLWGGLYTVDNTSDNQIGTGASNLFYPGEKKTVNQQNSEWKYENLRGINYFINKTEEKLEANAISGTTEHINHYLGEGYFFRAYDYFRLLRNYGDLPILKEMLTDDEKTLAMKNKRFPRNEVVRFMLEDLDKAITLMMDKAPETGRLCKDAARLMKARVALYEATWEKYHAGTAFVPANSNWPGKELYPDYEFPAGSPEAEYNFFFEQAINAAGEVAANRNLNTDYSSMFNNLGTFSDNDEVILARYYLEGVISHSASNYLGRTGAGTGLTRALVNTYLMTNGLPIYDSQSGYQGDAVMYYEMQERDKRLTSSVKIAGSLINVIEEDGKYRNDTIHYFRPQITLSGNEASTTGYEVKKFVSDVAGQDVQYKGTTATPIFRTAEAYLIYLEAYYERYGTLDSKCESYWRELRRRAGVDEDYNKTIQATDLAQENDLAVKWRGSYIDKTLYNIRRERRCEFLAEGMRLDDLKRWRSLDNMVAYQVEGMNLWEEMYKMYDRKAIGEGVVSQPGVSTYMRPLQKVATGAAYNGYTFPKAHYLEPIPTAEFLLATDDATGGSILYQNPGWPSKVDGTADYNANYD